MANEFGNLLKAIRLSRGYGLKQFADMIGELPSNLSAVEHGRRGAPTSSDKLRQMADALALVDGSPEWERFFFLAKQPGQLPAHVQGYTESEIFPVLCRTLNELRPTEDELKLLVELLRKHRRKAQKNAHD